MTPRVQKYSDLIFIFITLKKNNSRLTFVFLLDFATDDNYIDGRLRVGRKIVQDPIQDTSWDKRQHKKTSS